MTTHLQVNDASVAVSGNEEVVLSLLIPFEPKITSKEKIEANLRQMAARAAEQLQNQSLAPEVVGQMMMHLQVALAGVEYNNQKKSLAIKVTPQGVKLHYWNMPVQETIVVGNSFAVRQLAARKRTEKAYLLLAIGEHFGGIYLGNGPRLSRLVANSPSSDGATAFDPSPSAAIQRAVKHLDNALSILRRSYRYPVFVIAPGPYLNCFKELSPNAETAAALIEANPHGNDARLQQLMVPYLADWQTLTEKALVRQLDEALQKGKLAVGITECWTAAFEKKGQKLVVEEDYVFPAYLDQKNGVLYADAIPMNKDARKSTDAVDVLIEKVLADGGKVYLVRPGVLSGHLHVALSCY
ncbi:baeRF3 domain-containing protein [Pseudocnuella soli]|uniref:baeRF3 domain-containing protein n=1 Tax=Pseudocnuella soli TaxID=2502779 RepID=UPI00104634D0|nr:hypothetical protein [Pseudocnuella soli]